MIEAATIPTVQDGTPPAWYYEGRYLKTICPRCRHEHDALRTIPESQLSLIAYHSDVPLLCQLCGIDISGRLPVDMVFGQPWHIIKQKLPADLVDELDAWIASKESDEHPPNGLIKRLYDAYMKAKIEIFPR